MIFKRNDNHLPKNLLKIDINQDSLDNLSLIKKIEQFFLLIFLDIENGKILDQDILVNNEKGDEAPPNQSRITNIFKNFAKPEPE